MVDKAGICFLDSIAIALEFHVVPGFHCMCECAFCPTSPFLHPRLKYVAPLSNDCRQLLLKQPQLGASPLLARWVYFVTDCFDSFSPSSNREPSRCMRCLFVIDGKYVLADAWDIHCATRSKLRFEAHFSVLDYSSNLSWTRPDNSCTVCTDITRHILNWGSVVD